MELLSLELLNEFGELVGVDLSTSLLKNFFDISSRGLILSSENAESIGSKVFHITLDLLNNNSTLLLFFKVLKLPKKTFANFANSSFSFK